MIIKEIAFGNSSAAFIENRLMDRVNIIFSDDNNKGKTIVLQGLMYSIGYESIFPSSFNYKDQYFYSKIEIESNTFEFLRKKSSIIIRSSGSVQIFDSITDFKYFFDKNILPIPRIIKDHKSRMVDLSLLFELFFIGQDNRSPSNLISRGQFSKVDFLNMVYSIAGLQTQDIDQHDREQIKENLLKLKSDLKSLKKKLVLKKQNPNIAEIASKTHNNEVFQIKVKKIKALNSDIYDTTRAKNREINRKIKLENLIRELNSLNRKLEVGSVKCGDCGSDNILYSNGDLSFEISNTEVRSTILESIQQNINQKSELIEELQINLSKQQSYLSSELETTPPNFKEIILYQDEILKENNIDDDAFNIIAQIESLEDELKLSNTSINSNLEEQKKLLSSILDEMKNRYISIDPNGNLVFDGLFTKKDSTFSGSEEQEYYFSKLLALNNILNHNFPLIVDSFRDGEVSTYKENHMLEHYKRLNKQVILTSTLKKEEYVSRKYVSDENVKAIDYSSHTDSKILQEKYLPSFKKILDSYEGLVIL